MIRTQQSHLNSAGLTHAGMSGKNNEDRFAIASFQISDEDARPSLLAVLADGIGGHRAGEVAAQLACDKILAKVESYKGMYIKRIIRESIFEANYSIYLKSTSDNEHKGMGATCALAWIIEDKLHTAYVGDSRIYLMRDGRIQKLTLDHSWVQEAMEKNIIAPDEMRDHPNVHVIRRYLGTVDPPEPDFRIYLSDDQTAIQAEENQGTQLLPGDILLLCTDGLTDLVWDDEIHKVVVSNPNLEQACQALVDLANERGGHDNITVILVGVPNA